MSYVRDKMMLITVKIPPIYLELLDKLVQQGRYASRSEAIRVALRDFLKREGMIK